MSTNKTLQGELQHDDEAAAALPSPPEAHPVGAPTEPLRQADEPPSEATQSPNPRQPDGPAGTAGALTLLLPYLPLAASSVSSTVLLVG